MNMLLTFIKKSLMYRDFSTRTSLYRGKNNIGVIGGFMGNGKNSLH